MIGSIDRQPRGSHLSCTQPGNEQKHLHISRDTNTSISPPQLRPFYPWGFQGPSDALNVLTHWAPVSHSPARTQKHRHPQPIQRESISSKALGLKVATLGFRSGFLVAAAAQSGEAGWGFGPGRLGSAIVGLGCVSGWEETAGRWRKETRTLSGEVFLYKHIISLLFFHFYIEKPTIVS